MSIASIDLLNLVSTEPEVELSMIRMSRKYTELRFEATLCDLSLINNKANEPLLFVWPDEGEMTERGFAFNSGDHETEPLFVDIQTQQLLKHSLDFLNEATRARAIESMSKSRTKFCKLVGFFWAKVK